MDSLSSVSPSLVLPPSNRLSSGNRFPLSSWSFRSYRPRASNFSGSCSRRHRETLCKMGGGGDGKKGGRRDDMGSEDVDLQRALSLDGSIPGTSDEFVKRVSSRAYDMRRHLHQTFDSSSYDVLESNPWRETPKPVYVLTQRENQLCTMKTRRNRSEVEKEFGLLFPKGGKFRSGLDNQVKPSRTGTKFQMLVEDIRDGVLVFEDAHEAEMYCDLLQGGGRSCEGVAEVEASSVFDLCRKMRALAVLFRRGRTPPQPQSLELNLRARKRSLEDEED